jgi:hypothetical protein
MYNQLGKEMEEESVTYQSMLPIAVVDHEEMCESARIRAFEPASSGTEHVNYLDLLV